VNETAPVIFPLAGKRVWVAGHRGMVGSALVRRLERETCTLLTVDRATLDLRRQAEVEAWMLANRPEVVFIAAATVGGILANSTRPAEFLYDNIAIASNIISCAAKSDVAKLMFLGAACLYPRLAPQPMSEDSLLEGPPEPTNEWYAVAKIAGVKLCQAYRKQHDCDFIVAVPANLYGPSDRFDTQSGHVVPGLIVRAHGARIENAPALSIWGTGKARREFMHVDDCADALVFLMKTYSDPRIINVGTGEEVSIGELARTICNVVGYSGNLAFDATKPDGMPRKLLNSSRLNEMGWRGRTELNAGLRQTYRWALNNQLCRSEELTPSETVMR
jgi:GDP-L-fucose synthase